MRDKLLELLKPNVDSGLKLSAVSLFIGKMIDQISGRVESLEARQLQRGENGDKGDKGDRGERGPKGDKGDPGKDGAAGPAGRDGADGKRGPKGDKGVGVADVTLAADNHLVMKMTDGNEIDVGDLELLGGDKKSVIEHFSYGPNNTETIVLSKAQGYGVKVDHLDPSFCWQDLLGPIDTRLLGANEPVWAAYRGAIYAYTFDTATAECFITFHIPHDYVPGSDMYIHMHWSQIVVDTGGAAGVPGNIKWNFDITYADGHGTAGGAADPFIAPITVSVIQQGSTTQYGHMIAEVQFTNDGGTGGLIDSNTIRVDGLMLVRAYRVKGDAADTLNQVPFGHTCDIHYLSTGIGTKNKSPDFYA
jgi:hypothetical protein